MLHRRPDRSKRLRQRRPSSWCPERGHSRDICVCHRSGHAAAIPAPARRGVLVGWSSSSAMRGAGLPRRDARLRTGERRRRPRRARRARPRERRRRFLRAAFTERVDPALRAELAAVARHHGAAARRAADRMEPTKSSLMTRTAGASASSAACSRRSSSGVISTRSNSVLARRSWRRERADASPQREEVQALKFTAHRQLARWAKNSQLRPRQRQQRAALIAAVRALDAQAFAEGCELRATCVG